VAAMAELADLFGGEVGGHVIRSSNCAQMDANTPLSATLPHESADLRPLENAQCAFCNQGACAISSR